jgi:hypothetical protein
MAIEDIGEIFPTKIPGLDDLANIQEALRIYHYGSTTYDVNNTNKSQLPVPSLAHNLKLLEEDIFALEEVGTGSEFSNEIPSEVPDGYIWVDSESAGSVVTELPSVFYQNDDPEEGLTEGMLWVKKNSDPLTMFVYDSELGWREIGSYGEES